MSDILDYIKLVLVWSFFFSIIYIPARLLCLKKDSSLKREISLYLFWVSVLAILSQTLTVDGKVTGLRYSLTYLFDPEYVNFRPFRLIELIKKVENPLKKIVFAVINTAGNILIFVPVGFFARPAFRMKLWQATLLGTGLSVFVEIFQRFLPRSTDIDDVLLNGFGAFIGALLWTLLCSFCRLIRKKRSEKELSNG